MPAIFAVPRDLPPCEHSGVATRIAGAVLAAGQSRRMGRSKALLPCGSSGETFVARVVRALAEGGVDEVLVVGRPDDDALRRAVGDLAGSRFLENPAAERGQLSSLVVAADDAARTASSALLVMPVDMPLVRCETVAAVIAAFRHTRPSVVRATHRGRHGHPVLFSAALFDELRQADPSVGARQVVRAHAAEAVDLEVDDAGVLRDVDAASDYRAVFGADPE